MHDQEDHPYKLTAEHYIASQSDSFTNIWVGVGFKGKLLFEIMFRGVKFFPYYLSMFFWKTLTCYAHLLRDTYEEFSGHRNFTVTQDNVNLNWKQSVTQESNHYKSFFDYNEINNVELVARNAEYEALTYFQNTSVDSMIGIGRLGDFQLLNQGNDEHNTHSWLILLNHQQETITVALRGTSMIFKDILSDLDIRSVHLPCYMFPKSCRNKKIQVHHGFLNHFLNFGEQITNLVAIYDKMFPNYATVLTCHSLGAATGVLLLLHWKETYNVNFNGAYLFGLPIVGNAEFARLFNDTRIVKIFNENDIVPSLGYIHGHHIHSLGMWIRNKTIHNIDKYKELECHELTWKAHSTFLGIEINENYCKLNQTLSIGKLLNNSTESLEWENISIIMLTCIIILGIVYVVYSYLHKRK